MFKSIAFENYKPFSKGEIELKPITVLLGANSVGKSAILQLFLLLQQTVTTNHQNYKSALKLYGGLVNVGEPENIFKNKNIKNELRISFLVENKDAYEYLTVELYERYLSLFIEAGHLFLSDNRKKISLFGFGGKSKDDDTILLADLEDEDNFIELIEQLIPQIKSFRDEAPRSKDRIKYLEFKRITIFRSNASFNFFNEININDILLAYRFIKRIREFINREVFSIAYKLDVHNGELYIKEASVFQQSKSIIEIKSSYTNDDIYKVAIHSDIYDFKKLNKKIYTSIKEEFNPKSLIFNIFSKRNRTILSDDSTSKSSFFSHSLYRIFDKFQSLLGRSFSQSSVNYVSPLRAHPQRYYMLDKAKLNLALDTLDGDALAEVLKENSNIRNKVNEWLINFGLNVKVENFKEVIHKLKVEQNGLSLDITDVGFGISQILPVIIQGFLSKDESITIIEQPEIHLHPKMQADLADLFIDIAKSGQNKNLLIETHSEYLLKRLRRRIAEGLIDHDKVNIYLVQPNDDETGSILENLNIASGGAFKYPKSYYGGELLRDSTEFIKLQLKN